MSPENSRYGSNLMPDDIQKLTYVMENNSWFSKHLLNRKDRQLFTRCMQKKTQESQGGNLLPNLIKSYQIDDNSAMIDVAQAPSVQETARICLIMQDRITNRVNKLVSTAKMANFLGFRAKRKLDKKFMIRSLSPAHRTKIPTRHNSESSSTDMDGLQEGIQIRSPIKLRIRTSKKVSTLKLKKLFTNYISFIQMWLYIFKAKILIEFSFCLHTKYQRYLN